MNTTTAAAALEARVTAATVRTWCRAGVVAAVKQAGRWVIDTASLARRIAIGAMRTRKATVTIDFDATHTATYAGDTAPTTITVRVSKRPAVTTVRGLAPLLSDRIDAIEDEAARIHTLEVLLRGMIAIHAEACESKETGPGWADFGRLTTTYRGTAALPVSAVLDLAAEIRTAL